MKGSILLIEDNEQNRYLLTFLLEQSGYEVRAVANGAPEKAMEAGCAGYIAKPINPETFVAEMELVLLRPRRGPP